MSVFSVTTQHHLDGAGNSLTYKSLVISMWDIGRTYVRVCEDGAAMGSQGSPYARFRTALRAGNPTVVAAAAAEVGQLSLADALAVCLVFLTLDPLRYERPAVRWHARFCLEQRPAAT